MAEGPWPHLTAPYAAETVRWHVVRRSADGERAQLAPHLAAEAVGGRLDAEVGADGWSLRLRPWGDERLVAELSIGGVMRAAVARVADAPGLDGDGGTVPAGEAATGAALSAAATSFGVVLPLRVAGDDWVEADSDGGAPLYAPEAVAVRAAEGHAHVGAPATGPVPRPDSDPEPAPSPDPADAASHGARNGRSDDPEPAKPEAQEMIDRLVARLREEGLGADAARLVTSFGGYGRDAAASRELYAKLRSLLLERSQRR